MLRNAYYRWFAISMVILVLAVTFLFIIRTILITPPGKSIDQPTHATPTRVASTRPVLHTPTLSVPPTSVPAHPLQISSDPYTNSTSQHQTEVEPASYAYGPTIVAAFQAGRFFDHGSSNIGWATSINSGANWQHGFLPATTVFVGGPYGRITDPTVAYDAAHHTWMIASIAYQNVAGIIASSVLVSLSTNGGTAWSQPVTVADVGSIGGLDKDWLSCDNTPTSRFYSHCYLEWDNYNRNDVIQMSTSNDGGRTWGNTRMTVNQASGFVGYPLIQPDGTVIVPISNASQTVINVFTSTDGGASWSPPRTIATIDVAMRRCESAYERPAVAAGGFVDDRRAVAAGDPTRSIRAGVVDDEELDLTLVVLSAKRLKTVGQKLFLVECRYDDRNSPHRGTSSGVWTRTRKSSAAPLDQRSRPEERPKAAVLRRARIGCRSPASHRVAQARRAIGLR